MFDEWPVHSLALQDLGCVFRLGSVTATSACRRTPPRSLIAVAVGPQQGDEVRVGAGSQFDIVQRGGVHPARMAELGNEPTAFATVVDPDQLCREPDDRRGGRLSLQMLAERDEEGRALLVIVLAVDGHVRDELVDLTLARRHLVPSVSGEPSARSIPVSERHTMRR
jgi:hypothetical protein